MLLPRGWALASLVLTVAACAGALGPIHNDELARFEDRGFYHGELPYRVAYLPGNRQLMPEDWQLDNFYRAEGRERPKQSEEFLDALWFDTDGDGKHDVKERFYAYDLAFIHRRTNAKIWISSIPLASKHEDTDLALLADLYVESVAGAGYATIRIDRDQSAMQEKRYSSHLIESREVTVAGFPGYEFTFEVANVDQLELSRASRARVVRIVFLRPGFDVKVDTARYRGLLLLGCSAAPQAFDDVLPAYSDLINRLQLFPDAQLDEAGDAVLACTEPPLTELSVELEIGGNGLVLQARVEPPSQLGTLHERSLDPGIAAENEIEDRALMQRIGTANECVRGVLQGKARADATGGQRELIYKFSRKQDSRVRTQVTAYTSSPLGSPASTASAKSPAVAGPSAPSPAPAPHTPAPPPPASAPADEAELRARIEAKRDEILACTGTTKVALELAYQSSTLTIAIKGALAGSAEEACVQHALSDELPPSGNGRVVQLIK